MQLCLPGLDKPDFLLGNRTIIFVTAGFPLFHKYITRRRRTKTRVFFLGNRTTVIKISGCPLFICMYIIWRRRTMTRVSKFKKHVLLSAGNWGRGGGWGRSKQMSLSLALEFSQCCCRSISCTISANLKCCCYATNSELLLLGGYLLSWGWAGAGGQGARYPRSFVISSSLPPSLPH